MAAARQPGRRRLTNVRTNLGTLLRERGMTQADLADHLKVRQGAVSRWVRGEHWPDLERALQIAELLEVELEDVWSLRR